MRSLGFPELRVTLVLLAMLLVPAATMHRGVENVVPRHGTAALKAILTLNTAQVQYNSTYGRFATSLTELDPPTSGTANASSADLISSDLAAGEKQGYRFTLAASPAGYTIRAVPVSFGSTGSRTFFSDQSLVIRQNYGQAPATANSREVGSTATRHASSK